MGDPVSIGLTVALTAAQMAAQASQRIDGPRLQELAVSTADFGTPVQYFHATRLIDACPIIWAEKRNQVIKETKTKGGKQTNAIVFGTWAVLVAGHPSEAVLQILFNKQLVFDATGVGPQTPFAIGYTTISGKSGRPRERTINLADHMRIYYGAEDQMPDPRMQATVDAEHGPGSTPAYRGVTMIVFEEVPLEKFGNQVPTVGVLATRSAEPSYPYETFTVGQNNSRLWNTTLSPDGERLLWASNDGVFELWHLPTRSRIAAGNWPVEVNLTNKAGMYRDGSFLLIEGGVPPQRLLKFSADAVLQGDVFTFPTYDDWTEEVRVIEDASGTEHWMSVPFSTIDRFYIDGVPFDMGDLTGIGWRPTGWFKDADGNIWGGGCQQVFGTTTAYFRRFITVADSELPADVTVTGLAAASSVLQKLNAVHVRNGGVDQFVFNWGVDALYAIDSTNGSIQFTNTTAPLDVYNIDKQVANLAPGATSLWVGNGVDEAVEVSLIDLTEIRTVDPRDWINQDQSGLLYAPIINSHLCWPQFGTIFTIRALDRAGSTTVTLGSIAADIASQCNLDTGDVDFSTLTEPVRGLSWTQGSGKDVLDPLRELYDVDFRPHDFVLQGIARGGASGGVIASSDFARLDRDDPAFSAPTDGGTDLPRLLRMTFADADADQQVNAALAPRLSGGGGSVRSVAIDMSNLVLTAADGQQAAERMIRRRVFDAQSVPLALTGQYVDLEPGDVRTLLLGASPVTARLTRVSAEGDGSIATEWMRDDPSVHVLSGSAGAAQDGWVPPVMFIPGPTRGLAADVPLATDAHETSVPFVYHGAAPLVVGPWPGAEWQISDSGLADDFVGPWAGVASSDAMTWGYTTTAIPAALPWLFDRGTQMTVMMGAGATLTSVSEAALLADGALNLILVGGEYIQFATATLESDGSYTLTSLLRGCRGTEHAIGTHIAGETLVLVNSRLFRREVGAGEIGDTDAYRATTLGGDPVASPSSSIAFTAAAQRPYAPVHGSLALDTGTGDWAIHATRRTRIGGANIDGGDVPLGEVSEAWAADIMDGDSVVRTITGTTLPLAYTAADQTTDWGAPQTSLNVVLQQVSPALNLRGFPLAIAA